MGNNQQQINLAEIEDCVIGALLLADDFDHLADLVEKCDYRMFSASHAVTAYTTISTMTSKGIHAQLPGVFDVADAIGYSRNLLGGMEYLAHCVCACPSARNAAKYIDRLRGVLSLSEDWQEWVAGRQATATQLNVAGINHLIGTAVENHLASKVAA